MAWPSFVYDAPILQTDGIAYYGFAKVFSETNSLNSVVPSYFRFASVQESVVSDYPPFVTVVLGFLLKFGNDVFWLNGAFAGIFFAMAAYFIFLFAEYLRINPYVVVLVAMFNVRLFYTAWVGSIPAFVGFCFSIPALYFFVRFMDKKQVKDAVFALLFLLLVGLSYLQFVAYVFVLFVLLYIAKSMFSVKIYWPQFKAKVVSADYSGFWVLLVSLFVVAGIIKFFMFAASGRVGYVQDYMNYLLQNGVGYPHLWELPLITDNVFIVILAAASFIYCIYSQRWYLVALGVAVLGVLLSGSLLGLSSAWIYTYVLRFFTLNAVFLALLAGALLSRCWQFKWARNFFYVALLLQILMFVIFASIVGPAISREEMGIIPLIKQKSLLFVEDVNFGNSFSEPAWMIALSRPEKFEVVFDLPKKFPDGLILVDNYPRFDTKGLDSRKTLFKGKDIWLVE